MRIRKFEPEDEMAVVALWRSCDLVRPWNDPLKDIGRKLQVGAELFLVAEDGGEIVGCVMAGYEGHRGWLNYLAVAPSHRLRGVGREIVARAEELLRRAGCPKVNLQVRSGNADVIAFYQRLGYTDDDVVSLGKRLESDEPG